MVSQKAKEFEDLSDLHARFILHYVKHRKTLL